MENVNAAIISSIPQFNGTEIERWKVRMLSYFRRKQWIDLLGPRKYNTRSAAKEKSSSSKEKEKSEKSSETSDSGVHEAVIDDFEERNADMMDFIISKVHDDYLYLVSSKETAKEMWETVENTFAKNSRENTAQIRNEIFNMRHDRLSPISDHLKNFTKKMELLRNLGDKMKKEDFILQFLNSLPNEFSSLKVILADRDLEKITWEKFSSMVLSFGKEFESSSSSDFSTELPKGVTSFSTNTRGRNNYRPRTSPSQPGTSRQPIQCHNCGKYNHLRKDCRYHSNNTFNSNNNFRNSHSNNNNNNFQNRNFGSNFQKQNFGNFRGNQNFGGNNQNNFRPTFGRRNFGNNSGRNFYQNSNDTYNGRNFDRKFVNNKNNYVGNRAMSIRIRQVKEITSAYLRLRCLVADLKLQQIWFKKIVCQK